jgi:maltose alpha-D-glucosyltransferase/alpha-amylase
VTNFFHFQPALNYGFAKPDPTQPWQLPVDHPDVRAVRREMMKIMRYWLDMGADGFRVDMAASLIKKDSNLEETILFWQEVRAMYDREYPDAALISEWSMPSLAIRAGFHIDFMIHFGTNAYTSLFRHEAERDVFRSGGSYGHSFFDRAGKGDIKEFLDIYLQHYEATRELGFISIPSGNHDISRLNCGRTAAELEVAFAFFMTMPGIPYIYMGDEIGMAHIDGLPSKEGGYGRTGARTPMQWNQGKNAGFSSCPAEKLYLPLDPRKSRPTVAAQDGDPNSLLNRVRELVKLRHATPALGACGEFVPLHAKRKSYPFVYLRRLASESVVVALNPSETKKSLRLNLPEMKKPPEILLSRGTRFSDAGAKLRLEMDGLAYAIFKIHPHV